MHYGFYLSAAGMMMQDVNHSVIANNIANVSTTGFKRATLSFKEMLTENELVGRSPRQINRALNETGGGVLLNKTHTNFSTGSLQPTDNNYDLALTGEGFFKVTDGEKFYYTRAGAFTRNAENGIVTLDGLYHLVDSTDKPLTLQPGEFRVLEDGRIQNQQTQEEAGMIKVVNFENPDNLERYGHNLFAAGREEEIPAENAQIRQGYLEGSNAEGIGEMVNLIEASRMYQANASFLRMQEAALGQLLTVGRVQ